jgi:general stress protein 26
VDAKQAGEVLEGTVLSLLSEGRIMSVATIRPDGWPQVTTVGYVNAGLTLFFAVASTSQKFRNIQRDHRISIAIAFAPDGRRQGRGLSMAARATQIVEADEIERINDILAKRYFGRAVFAPRGASAVILRATPTIISLTDDSGGITEPQTFLVPQSPPMLPAADGAQEA